MDLYVIRRPSGWDTGKELEAAAARSAQVDRHPVDPLVRRPRGGRHARHVLHLPGVE